jgi:flagellar hook-associated protein 2
MGPAVTFGGIGSGMDIEGLISGLVGVSRQPVSRLQSRAAAAKAAVTDLSNVGGLLSKLKTAATALDSMEKVGSYKTETSNEKALGITANGNAQPGSYEIEVLQLATAERRYSDSFASNNTALGMSGTLTLQMGTGDTVSPDSPILVGGDTATLNIEASDTLDSIIQKINDSGLRVKASSFYDGNEYRLQLRGLDAGEDNAIIVGQNGIDLGLENEDNIVNRAQDAKITVDGFEVKSKTNTIGQAIPGVTLNLKQVTDEPFTISVQDDTDALGKKVQDFVDAYNAVINQVHTTAGFGKTKASNPLLAGDSALRGITNRLNTQLSRTFGSGAFNTMASLGIQLNNNGTLKLDQTKLSNAISKDPSAVSTVLAGGTGSDGIMDMMRDLVSNLTAPNTGTLDVRKEGLDAQARRFNDQIGREEKRLESLESRLRKTFSEMDSTVAGYNAQLNYLLANR